VTVVLLLMTILSVHTSPAQSPAFAPADSSSETNIPFCSMVVSASNHADTNCTVATATSPDGLQLVLVSNGPFVSGDTVYLLGQGFTPGKEVTLLYDNNRPCQPAIVKADAHGRFNIKFKLAKNNTPWQPGNHQLTASDASTQHTVSLALLLHPVVAHKLPTPTPSATPTSDATAATAVATNAGNNPPPAVQRTPTAVQPTVVPSPTLIPATALPTVTVSPTPSPGASEPTATPSVVASQPSSDVSQAGIPRAMTSSQNGGLIQNSTCLFVVVILGYALALFSLSLAALLYRRRSRLVRRNIH